MENEKLADWLTALVRGMVSKPNDVHIDRKVDEQGVLYTIKVADEDVGRVIGKGGACASAIRELLRVAGSLLDERASMKVDAPRKEADGGYFPSK